MTDKILNILKIIGLIFIFIISFGLINRFNKKERITKIDEEIKEIENEIVEIEKEEEIINDKIEEKKVVINNNKTKINKVKEKIKNPVIKEIKSAKEAVEHIKEFLDD